MSTHAEKRVLPYTPEQLYRLVAEVERYPEFLPWCLAVRIRKREGDMFWADLVIGFKMIRERFTSKVELRPDDRRIDVAYTEGPFKRLDNHWIFNPQPDGTCEIDFYVDFEFKNRVLQGLMHVLFDEAVKRMVNAFEARAKAMYGAGS